jgi:eukaryotic-like serine/threonine-protein kinase
MSNDERLAALLERVTRQGQEGQEPDFEALKRDYPDLIGELQQLVNVAQLARQFGPAASAATIVHPRSAASAAATWTPPRSFGVYQLVDEIGRGAMGVVYKAWDPRLKRFVALKVLLGGEHAAAADLVRFRTEARAAAAMAHRNIVPVYEVGECDGRAFFSMRYVEGATLAAKVSQGPLPPREAARLVALVAQAVEHAHQNGILHRDLKPSNVLLDVDQQPLVTDFGLAKRTRSEPGLSASGEPTATGVIVGTPSYMAPEQAAGTPAAVGPASDVYSLGAILYELLTGRPPFQAASAVDVLLLVRGEEAVRPRLLNPSIDPDLELICLKCLEKRPDHRYASAALLAADLEAYLAGETVSARSSSLAYFLSRLLRDTHHAPVMENWGGLWMLHSLNLLLLCVVTNAMWWVGVRDHLAFLLLWSVGLVVWAMVFWSWRRRGGAVTFVERQMAHGWAAGVAASIGVFLVEVALGLPALTLTPVLAVVAGMVFLFMAGTVSGWFYLPAALCFAGTLPMAFWPGVAPTLFGIMAALGFFVPGLKYYRKSKRARNAVRLRSGP